VPATIHRYNRHPANGEAAATIRPHRSSVGTRITPCRREERSGAAPRSLRALVEGLGRAVRSPDRSPRAGGRTPTRGRPDAESRGNHPGVDRRLDRQRHGYHAQPVGSRPPSAHLTPSGQCSRLTRRILPVCRICSIPFFGRQGSRDRRGAITRRPGLGASRACRLQHSTPINSQNDSCYASARGEGNAT
jgi:hypothetical protein